MARMVRKGDLPTKICMACERPFAWRKKWARDWEQVKFCSDRCRSGKGVAARDVSAKGGEKGLGVTR